MPFQCKTPESYVVAFKKDNDCWMREGCLGALVILGLLCLASIFIGGMTPVNTAVNLTAFLLLVLLYGLMQRRGKPPRQLWVCGETFCVVEDGRRGRTYRFSEITRVQRWQSMTIGTKQMTRGPESWRIEVDGTCVAEFTLRMENAGKLLKALDDRGLITPYGTGIGAENRRTYGAKGR